MDFSGQCLFRNVDLNLSTKMRYVVVGANGSGKSTFLKLIAEQEHPVAGVIDKPKKISVSILKQDHFRYENENIIDIVLEGKPELFEAFQKKNRLLESSEFGERECLLLAELEELITALDGYSAQSRAEIILQGLGIISEYHFKPLSCLSGGYKLRVLLAQALFQDPDVLLLDEPTNHLDIVSIVWLEKFLKSDYHGLLIFVSHDHNFINNLATCILDVDYETITAYPGNFDTFLAKKAEAFALMQHDLAHKKQKIASMQEYADRFRATPSKAKQALSRLKMIERIELPDIKNTSRIRPNFTFEQHRPTGKRVVRVEGLAKSFGVNTLFTKLDFIIQQSQKCAIIGPNGVGKSTVLKILLNQIDPDIGHFSWSETTSVGYFAQAFYEQLSPEISVLQWLRDNVSDVDEMTMRKILGAMLFSGSDVDKTIKTLSGGECARLMLAKLILEKHNVLILDEPTNHLDLEAIEGLAIGLQQFPGAILFVSHNRYLVQQVASHLLVMNKDSVEFYPGTYDEYITNKQL
jgi:ATPase subunit of ABC transporter with duplicated ATPase domains